MPVVDKIRKLLAGKTLPASSELQSALINARADATSAEEALATIEAARPSVLVDGDDAAKARHRAERDAAVDWLDTAREIVRRLEARLAEARDAEARAEFQRLDAEVDAIAAEATKFAKDYAALTAKLLAGVSIFARASAAVAARNAARPEGVAPRGDVETEIRGRPGSERRVVSEKTVTRWAYEATGVALADDLVPKIIPAAGGKGMLDLGGWNRRQPVVKRQFIERTTIDGVRAEWPAPLAETLVLPALRVGEPAAWSPMAGSARPEDVLAEIERRRTAAVAGPAEPATVVELVPVDGDNETVAA